MSSLRALFLVLVLIGLTPAGHAAEPEQAVRLVQTSFHEAVSQLRSHRDAVRADPERAYQLLSDTLAPYVDFELMSRLVLARHWARASEQQRARFVAAFRESLLRDYAGVLAEHVDKAVGLLEGQERLLEIEPVRAHREDRLVVRTRLVLDQVPAVGIDYRLYARDGQWKVYDVMIEGISFITNRRAELASLLNRESLDQLIARLDAHNRQAWQQ